MKSTWESTKSSPQRTSQAGAMQDREVETPREICVSQCISQHWEQKLCWQPLGAVNWVSGTWRAQTEQYSCCRGDVCEGLGAGGGEGAGACLAKISSMLHLFEWRSCLALAWDTPSSIRTVSMESLKIFSTLATLRHSYAKYSGSSLLLNWLARPSSSKSLKLYLYLCKYLHLY